MKYLLLAFVFLFGFSLDVSALNQYVSVKVEPIQNKVLPKNAVRIPFIYLDITANEDVKIDEIVVRQIGLSDNEDVEKVYIEGNYARSLKVNVGNDGLARVRFLRGYEMRSGQRERLAVYANLDVQGSGRTVGFELSEIITSGVTNNISRNTGSSSYGGGFSGRYRPYVSQARSDIAGSRNRYTFSASRFEPRRTFTTARTSSYQAPEISFKALSGGGTIQYGRLGRVGRFRLENESNKDVGLGSFRLKNFGTADLDDVFDQLELRLGGQSTVALSERTDRDYVYFDLAGYKLDDKDGETFEIWGIPLYAKKEGTISLGLDSDDEIVAAEGNQIQRPLYTGYSPNSKFQNTSSYTLDRARTSIGTSRAGYGHQLWNQNYNPNSRDVTFLSQSVSHKAPYQIEMVRAFVATGSAVGDRDGDGNANQVDDYDAAFDDLRLFINGQSVDNGRGFDEENGRIFIEFDADYVIDGVAQFVVQGRITNNAKTGDKLRLLLDRNQSFPDGELYR